MIFKVLAHIGCLALTIEGYPWNIQLHPGDAPARQIRLPSDSISKFISTLVLGNSSSSNISKNEYRFSGISVFTVDETPKSAFRRAKPLL